MYLLSRMDVPVRPVYYLHFTNFYERAVLIVARVELMKQRITPISKETMDPTTTKLSVIAESFKVRSHHNSE